MNETIGPENRWPVQWTDRLQRLATELSGVVDPASMAQQAVAQVQAALDADAGVVFLLSPDGASLQIAHASGYEARTSGPWTRFPLTANLPVTDAIRTREAVLVGSPEELVQRYPELAATPGAFARGSWAAVPLVADDVCIGALGLSFGHGHTFEVPKVAFLRVVADQCAQALHRADLAERERRSTARLRVLAEASRILAAASLDVASVVDALGRQVLAHVGRFVLDRPRLARRRVAGGRGDPRSGSRSAEAPARGGREAPHAARGGPLGQGVRHRERGADRLGRAATRWRSGPRPRSPSRSKRFASTACSRLRSRRAGGPGHDHHLALRREQSLHRRRSRLAGGPGGSRRAGDRERAPARGRATGARARRGGRPAQGRVPRDAGPRAAQPAGADLDGAGGHARSFRAEDDRQIWAREAIARQVAQLSRLVDDLLDVSRINLGKIDLRLEPLDLGAVALQALEASRPLLSERDHQVTAELPRGARPRAGRRRPAHAGHRQPPQQRRQVHRPARSRAPPRRVRRRRSDGHRRPTPASASRPSMLERVFDLFAQGRDARATIEGRPRHRPDPGQAPGGDARRVRAGLERRRGARQRLRARGCRCWRRRAGRRDRRRAAR